MGEKRGNNMKVEFIGVYKKHEIKKTKSNKEYVELTCLDNVTHKTNKIFIFKQALFDNLEMLQENDNIAVIFDTWYSTKNKNQVLIVKDIVPC